jgi:hypothetical protein
MKTSELIGRPLDVAVEIALQGGQLRPDYNPRYAPEHSTNWSHGGPIVEREIDQISRYETYPDYRADRFATDDYEDCHAIGPTMLIAAMRCYVASKLGDEVEIPEELL